MSIKIHPQILSQEKDILTFFKCTKKRHSGGLNTGLVRVFFVIERQCISLLRVYTKQIVIPPASKVSRGVYGNQAQKNFTHLYTEYL